MTTPMVLVVEDDLQVQRAIRRVHWRTEIAFAMTLADARAQIVKHFNRLVVVVLDGDIEPDTTIELIGILKSHGNYGGLLVAHSANRSLLEEMTRRGCTHAILKGEKPFFECMTAILQAHSPQICIT